MYGSSRTDLWGFRSLHRNRSRLERRRPWVDKDDLWMVRRRTGLREEVVQVGKKKWWRPSPGWMQNPEWIPVKKCKKKKKKGTRSWGTWRLSQNMGHSCTHTCSYTTDNLEMAIRYKVFGPEEENGVSGGSPQKPQRSYKLHPNRVGIDPWWGRSLIHHVSVRLNICTFL